MEIESEPYGLHVDRRVAPFVAAAILGALVQVFPSVRLLPGAWLLVGALFAICAALVVGAQRGFPRPLNLSLGCLGLFLALWPWTGPNVALRAAVTVGIVAICAALHYAPWSRLPLWLRLVVPGGAAILVGVFAYAGDTPPWLVFPLVLLAVLWTALAHRTRDLVLVTALSIGVLVFAGSRRAEWLIQTPLFGALLVLVGASVHALLRRARESAVSAGAVADVLRSLVEGQESGSVRQSLCVTLNSILGSSHVSIFELDRQAGQLVPTAAEPRFPPIRVALSGEVFGADGTSHGVLDPPPAILQAFRTRRAVFSPSLEPLGRHGWLRDQEQQAGVRSTYCHPVLRGAEAVAVLVITWRRSFANLPPEMVRLVDELANEIGLLLAQADLQRRVEALARTDSLTEAANRRHWESELDLAIARARRDGGPLCVAILDLDHFKAVNDDLGHQAGDRLLHSVALRWAVGLRQADVLGRYGGDEFAILLPSCEVEEALDVVERLRMLSVDDAPFSAGVARWNGEEGESDLLLRADGALYEAKRSGGGTSRVAQERAAANEAWVSTLQATLAGAPIATVMQPIKRLADGAVVGWEALSRFEGLGDDVEPLFHAARRLGVSRDLDWLCLEAAIVHAAGLAEPIFLNTSVWSLLDLRHPPEQLAETVRRAGLDPTRMVLELSERDRLSDSRVAEAVRSYRACGFSFALDDLGVGQSTIEMLVRIEAAYFKVAAGLLRAGDARSQAAIGALTHFTQRTGGDVIAEGIETQRQVKQALALGIGLGQGYLLGRPAPADVSPLRSAVERMTSVRPSSGV
ncbi:MAG TPA: diguanylate cyclase [Candidatus Dormibacteraeota bacterium]